MFRELDQGMYPTPAESIHDHVGSEALPDADRVVAYLRAGHPLIDMMDIQDDPLEPDRQVMNGSSIVTDGTWFWRYDFAYYVRRHRVVVPEEFLGAIRESHYLVPEVDEARLTELAKEAALYAFGPKNGARFSES
jgi:hypothetical protein